MVICRFFLEGKCRFGDNCRNEHVRAGKNVFFKADRSFQGESLIEDDLGKDHPQWPFTCYGTGKGHPNLISGKDISPEELRTVAYKYMENMDFYGYQNTIKKLSEEIQELRNNMIRNSKKACKIAINLLNGKFSGNIDAIFSNTFSSRPSAFSTFSIQLNLTKTHPSFETNMSMPVNSSNAFGKIEPSTASLFKKDNPVFSPFCSNSSNGHSFGIHNSPLNTTSSNGPIFGNTSFIQVPANFANTSAFKINDQSSYLASNAQNSVFGQHNIFNSSQTQSAFSYKSAFNQQPSIFDTSNTPQMSHEKMKTSEFTSNMTTASTFAFQPTLQEASLLLPAFLTPNHHTSNPGIISPNLDTSNTLSESDLPPSALKAFKAEAFTLGEIPEMEPPPSLRN
ncbi:uncharacterized protein T551_01575 [Pneumocystis jirovecii RU7]|uniref:C3H1-type domain-containing protein n=1 Tax=Pneumocystis jirovecii (strain RU7) TaxID=1408657 RepID=A0A0W4ZRM5_PNEJ7|nr:uncharacterized protein T551_01575 [Pneumocystis jirovecii RU7]KTW31023.1 hypothetical protein T551_01575 [Pneumocystis jirovecii RU7]